MQASSVDIWIGNSEEVADGLEGNSNNQEHAQEQFAQHHSPPADPVQGTQEYDNHLNYDAKHEDEGCNDVYSESMPDILYLNHYCAHAHPPQNDSEDALREADEAWEPVRDWMRTHSAEEVQAAAEQRDEAGKTALHFACQNAPPVDIIDVFLSVTPYVVQWSDSFGWLPIHYACAYGADTQVIKSLAEVYPESKCTVDRKGRTPLHFALGTTNVHSAAVIVVLCSTGAASYADDNGMLPLHYACAYGASEDCLYVLTDAFHDAITTIDTRGRTPLHFALSNAGRKAAPSAVRLLLNLNRNVVNSENGGPLPLRVLAEFATTVPNHEKQQRESCKSCLRHLLGAHPDPTADFFNALQSLPQFLQELAVVMKVVQELLNFKIAQRFPTMILLLDFYVQMMVVTFYSITTKQSFDHHVVPKLFLYIGASYFLLRELIQIISLLSLGALRIWAYEPSNWLNVIYVAVVYFWTINMTTGNSGPNTRALAIVTIIFIWSKFLSYLRNMLLDFAVFAGGVFHVMRRLAAFFVCLIIILVAFSRMFYTIFQQSKYCNEEDPTTKNMTEDEIDDQKIEELQCGSYEIRPWCDGWDAFLALYTMLLGEVDETRVEEDPVATVLFIIFMFLVVILLANVLIAIVTDSYKVIQDQRAAFVFWTNRLNFIAQMDAIANGPWKGFLIKALGMRVRDKNGQATGVTNAFGKIFWKRLMDLFEDELEDGMFSVEYIVYTCMRVLALVLVIPSWVVLGIVTAGWLWPPQIREFFFTSKVTKHNSEFDKEEELRRTQIVKVKAEIDVMRDELRQELALDRTQIVQTKSLVAERKIEIQSEMKHIKRIVTMLFEQQGNM